MPMFNISDFFDQTNIRAMFICVGYFELYSILRIKKIILNISITNRSVPFFLYVNDVIILVWFDLVGLGFMAYQPLSVI